MSLADVIPWYYRWLAIALLILGTIAFGFVKGMKHVQDKWDSSVQKENLLVTQKVIKQGEITTKVLTQYVDRVRIVKEKGEEITKNVPIYVNTKNDADCVINHGFIVLHDSAANQNPVPDSTGISNDSPSELKLSTVLTTITENYAIAIENSERLKALQQWVRGQYELK